MSKFILKTISPILYSVFLIPVTIIIGIIVVLIDISPYSLHSYSFVFVGYPEMLATLGIVGTIGFLLGSKLITEIEKASKVTFLDHIRQSSVFYLITASALFYAFRDGDHKLKGDVAAITIATISVWAIIINSVYLIFYNKQTSGNSN